MIIHKRHYWKLIPPIIIMIIIFVHSSMDGDMSTLESDTLIRILGIPLTDTVVVVVRKCAHLTEYAVLGASMYLVTEDWQQAGTDRTDRTQEIKSRSLRYGPIWKAWLAASLYAVTDEIHQHFVPGRSAALVDILIDSIGCLLGVVIMRSILRWRASRHRVQEKD